MKRELLIYDRDLKYKKKRSAEGNCLLLSRISGLFHTSRIWNHNPHENFTRDPRDRTQSGTIHDPVVLDGRWPCWFRTVVQIVGGLHGQLYSLRQASWTQVTTVYYLVLLLMSAWTWCTFTYVVGLLSSHRNRRRWNKITGKTLTVTVRWMYRIPGFSLVTLRRRQETNQPAFFSRFL